MSNTPYREMSEEEYIHDPVMQAAAAFAQTLREHLEISPENAVRLVLSFISNLEQMDETEMRRRWRILQQLKESAPEYSAPSPPLVEGKAGFQH